MGQSSSTKSEIKGLRKETRGEDRFTDEEWTKEMERWNHNMGFLSTPDEYRALTMEIENLSKDIFTWLYHLALNPKAPGDRCVYEFHKHPAEKFAECAGSKKFPAIAVLS